MRLRALDERGLTLTELTIVGLIAALTMVSLVGFYINAQLMWTDASTQVITQREATNVVTAMSGRIHSAAQAIVTDAAGGGSSLCQIQLIPQGGGNSWYFWWDQGDSLIHEGTDPGDPLQDRGPMLSSKVDRFELTADTAVVRIIGLRVRTTPGNTVEIAASAQMMNKTNP